MRRFLVPLFMAVIVASLFCPWLVEYDIPYPGVQYEDYVFGYECICGWFVIPTVIILAVFQFIRISKSFEAMNFVCILCSMTGILITFTYIMSTLMFNTNSVAKPFFGVIISMLSFGGLLCLYTLKKNSK